MFKAKTMAMLLGVIFIAVGVLGFIPNPLVSSEGLFVTNAMHNLVHVFTGIAFLVMRRYAGKESILIASAGAVYAVVAVLGFMTQGDHLLGLVHINQADRWLHAGLAVAIIFIGVVSKSTPLTTCNSTHTNKIQSDASQVARSA